MIFLSPSAKIWLIRVSSYYLINGFAVNIRLTRKHPKLIIIFISIYVFSEQKWPRFDIFDFIINHRRTFEDLTTFLIIIKNCVVVVHVIPKSFINVFKLLMAETYQIRVLDALGFVPTFFLLIKARKWAFNVSSAAWLGNLINSRLINRRLWAIFSTNSSPGRTELLTDKRDNGISNAISIND